MEQLFFKNTYQPFFRFAGPLSDTGDVRDMPVPASYNDIPTEDRGVTRDHVGWAWSDMILLVSMAKH